MRHFGLLVATTLALCVALLPAPARAATLTTDPRSYDQGFGSDPEGAVAAARKRANEGDLDGAIRELAKYVAAHPRELAPARLLGDLYYRVPDLKAAEKQYQAVILIFPNDRETRNRLGGVLAAQDRIPEAIAEFQKALPDIPALPALVRLHRTQGDLPAFEADFRRKALDRPSDAFAQGKYGEVLLYQGDRALEALAQFQKVIALGVSGAQPLEEIYANMGWAYLDLHDYKNAIAALRKALTIAPNYYGALVNMSDAYIEQHDYVTAKTYLSAARLSKDDGFEALVNLGYIEDKNQRWKEAVALYQQAISLNPMARDAYINLGYDYREHGMLNQAEATLVKGLSVSPGDPWLHYLLGTVYFDQGKRALYRAEIEKAAKSDDPIVAPVAKQELARLDNKA